MVDEEFGAAGGCEGFFRGGVDADDAEAHAFRGDLAGEVAEAAAWRRGGALVVGSSLDGRGVSPFGVVGERERMRTGAEEDDPVAAFGGRFAEGGVDGYAGAEHLFGSEQSIS